MQKAFDKQARLLAASLHHPSLHAKKYDESRDIGQARVNKDGRFYFTIIDDTYRIEDSISHPKLTGRIFNRRLSVAAALQHRIAVGTCKIRRPGQDIVSMTR